MVRGESRYDGGVDCINIFLFANEIRRHSFSSAGRTQFPIENVCANLAIPRVRIQKPVVTYGICT
jgi:hypothetical protein